jgi:anti-sigma regulatory factor (Ser/Thr protein kinase)
MNEKTDSELKGETLLQCHLTLPNDINTIPQLSEFIDLNCEELGVDMVDTMNINLALEEAVVNVMSYAYPEGTEGQVDIEMIADGDNMIFTITDSGTPFDPTQKEEVDTTLSAEERPIGGLGIHLVRKLMDTISYQYVDNKNVLTLKKKLNKA